MYTPKANRKNVFKQVHLQRGRDLFARVGKRIIPPDITSDGEIVPMNMDKIDSIEFLDRYDAILLEKERERVASQRQRSAETEE